MDKIWANRLIAGTKKWNEVPNSRKAGVKIELSRRVKSNEINADVYYGITGEGYVA